MKTFLKTEEARDTANFVLQMFVGVSIVTLNVVLLVLVATERIKSDNVVTGALLTQLGILVSFCFPNTIGAQRQQDTIAKLATKPQEAINVDQRGEGSTVVLPVRGDSVGGGEGAGPSLDEPISPDQHTSSGDGGILPERPPNQRG